MALIRPTRIQPTLWSRGTGTVANSCDSTSSPEPPESFPVGAFTWQSLLEAVRELGYPMEKLNRPVGQPVTAIAVEQCAS